MAECCLNKRSSCDYCKFTWVCRAQAKCCPLAILPQEAQAVAPLFWTSCATLDPNLHLCHGVCARERRQGAAIARIPPPANKIVVGHVIEKRLKGSPAILLGVLNLSAQLSR